MQKLTNKSLKKKAMQHLYNIEESKRLEFVNKLTCDNLLSFLSESLDSLHSEIVGTALILYYELIVQIDSKTVYKIAGLLKHNDEWVQERASEALIKFANSSVISSIEQGMNDGNTLVRSNLCEALSNIKDDVSINLIMKHIQDTNGLVRASAIESAQKMMLKQSIPLIEKLLNDRDSLVRGQAAIALPALQGKEAIPMLEIRLKTERNPYAKLKLMESLYELTHNQKLLARIDRVSSASKN
jgi:HEAT repeat protein